MSVLHGAIACEITVDTVSLTLRVEDGGWMVVRERF